MADTLERQTDRSRQKTEKFSQSAREGERQMGETYDLGTALH